MGRLYVFNPDHDYALSQGNPNYTPPASVVKLERQLQFLPLVWARDDDFILTADNQIVRAADIRKADNLRVKDHDILSIDSVKNDIDSIEPWGWDGRMQKRVQELNLSHTLSPSDEFMKNLRRLSHRRISIAANNFMNSPAVPCEFFNIDDALDFAVKYPGCYFKLPWSGGGRGVVATRELTATQIFEWVSGAIRRQGSVIGEIGIERILDFATLWKIDQHKVNFLGLSLSLSDGRGKYDGNMYSAQDRLREYILQKAPAFNQRVLDSQKEFISQYLSPFYNGFLGIDMMADEAGYVYPCVEINLRRTMGHVAMAYHLLSPEDRKRFEPLNLPLKPLCLI